MRGFRWCHNTNLLIHLICGQGLHANSVQCTICICEKGEQETSVQCTICIKLQDGSPRVMSVGLCEVL